MNKKLIAGALAAGTLVLSGCAARNIDVGATGALPVPGATNLYYLCHGPTLVYVTLSRSDANDDEYEAMWPGWCALDTATGKWFYDVTGKTLPPATTNGNTDDGDDK